MAKHKRSWKKTFLGTAGGGATAAMLFGRKNISRAVGAALAGGIAGGYYMGKGKRR